jgi:hypothetical protein
VRSEASATPFHAIGGRKRRRLRAEISDRGEHPATVACAATLQFTDRTFATEQDQQRASLESLVSGVKARMYSAKISAIAAARRPVTINDHPYRNAASGRSPRGCTRR